MPAWVKRIFELVRGCIPRDFIGTVEINCYQGGVRNVNVKQSFKESDPTHPEKESDLAVGRG